MHIRKVDWFLSLPRNNQDYSIAKHLDPNLLGTLSAQAYVRTLGDILTHFWCFWRHKSTWLWGKFAQLGFMTFLYLVEVFLRRWRYLISIFWGNLRRGIRNQWPCLGQQPPLTPFGCEGRLSWMDWLCCWVSCLGQGKSLSPLSDHTNRIINSLLVFHCTGRVAQCKYFSHLFICVADSICSKWWAHKIIALLWVRKLLTAIKVRLSLDSRLWCLQWRTE